MLRGRDAQLAALEQLLGRARDGAGGALAIHAEPGMGKTAMLEAATGLAGGAVSGKRGQHQDVRTTGASSKSNPRTLRAKAKIAECDTKLARHRAALEAGADLATVTGWIADTNAQRVAAQAELRAADNQPHKALSPDDIEDMITTLGGLVAILHHAQPEDRHSIYDKLGIRLTYHPEKHEIRVEATLHPDLLVAPHDSQFGQTVRDRGRIETVCPNPIEVADVLPFVRGG